MKKFTIGLSLILSIYSLFPIDGTATEFYTLRTKNLRLVYYSKDHLYIVDHLARCFENSLKFHRQLFDYTPSEDVLLFLQDFDDYGYAGATSLPINYMILGIEPYEYVYDVSPTNERMNWVMSHELMHVVATDKAASSDKLFRNIFQGKVSPTADEPISMLYSYMTNPRKYSPRWYHEGIAVFFETWMAGGIGRVMGGYDEMVFRTMVQDSSYFYDVVGLESEGTTIDFQVGANSYLYGTRFVSYLAYQYGPEKLLQWFNRTDTSNAYFSSQFSKVYNGPLDDEWSRWIRFEHEWQRANLDSVARYPLTVERKICPDAVGAISRAFYDSSEKKLYLGVNYPGKVCHLAAVDILTGESTRICDMPTPSLYNVSSTAFDPQSHTFFYTTHNSKGWRDINAVDVHTGDSRVIAKSARTGDLAFNNLDQSLWGVQHHNGTSRLVRFPQPYDTWQEVLPLKYGMDLFDPDISPDGSSLVASIVNISGKQHLIRLNINELLNGNPRIDTLYEFKDNSPENFVFSNDGRFLFGTTYATGVSNVVRYDLENRKMEWISNCETGLFRPVPMSKDSLIAFRYTGKGFLPVVIANETREDVSPVNFLGYQVLEKYPIVKTWVLAPPSPSNINIDSLTISTGEYSPFASLRLASAYPVVEGYKNVAAVGMRFNVFDPLLLHNFDATFSYSPSRSVTADERFHGTVNYEHLQWHLSSMYNGVDFYDLFGPTKTSRKGYSLSVQYSDAFIDDKPTLLEYTVSTSGYGGLEQLPDFQNVSTSFDKFLTLSAKLNYSKLMRSLGAVDLEQGTKWSLGFNNVYVRSRMFPRIHAEYELGIALPIDHSSVWLRSSAGYSFGDKDESFANFYFGGFGNNWVDHANEKRYREYYSFPGIELNEVGGVNYGKISLEWNLPPIRFRRLGFPALYCNWSRIALFSSGIATNMDDQQERRSLVNAGAQIDFRIVMFSNLQSTLSFGYAVAFEKDQHFSREFMASLKIL